jgi:branched-subunit amino acid transport protein
MSWSWIGLAAAGCLTLKLVGLLVPERVLGHPAISRVAAAVPVALLGALIAVQTFTEHQRIVLDARIAGIAAAAAAVLARAPFLVVVLIAAATTAALRWFHLAS